MEIIKEEKTKKIFEENGKIYTLIDMGAYVGHRNRNWWENTPECWRLMFCDEKNNDNETFHIEALVNDSGDYIRFLIEKDEVKRIINVTNDYVYQDFLFEKSNDLDFGEQYVALEKEIYDSDKLPLREYLKQNQTFYSNNKEKYNGETFGNEELLQFLLIGLELVPNVEKNKKR